MHSHMQKYYREFVKTSLQDNYIYLPTLYSWQNYYTENRPLLVQDSKDPSFQSCCVSAALSSPCSINSHSKG